MREAVMRRGVRAVEAAQGSGLGLAIVGDLAKGSTADRFRLRTLRWEARPRASRCRLKTRPNGMQLAHVALLQNSLATQNIVAIVDSFPL